MVTSHAERGRRVARDLLSKAFGEVVRKDELHHASKFRVGMVVEDDNLNFGTVQSIDPHSGVITIEKMDGSTVEAKASVVS